MFQSKSIKGISGHCCSLETREISDLETAPNANLLLQGESDHFRTIFHFFLNINPSKENVSFLSIQLQFIITYPVYYQLQIGTGMSQLYWEMLHKSRWKSFNVLKQSAPNLLMFSSSSFTQMLKSISNSRALRDTM